MPLYRNNGVARLFEPIMIHGLKESGNDMASINMDSISIHELQDGTITNDTSLGVSASHKYDTDGVGLRSTQQLPVDWSDFANHTFFNSAQVKTNVAFEQILNKYPFDGTQQQAEVFLDGLTGFERHVYDLFPKYTNYLFFSGSAVGEGGAAGTFVTVRDMAGAAYTETSTKTTAQTILDPRLKSMTFEMHLWLPEMSSSNQVVVDKHVTLGSNNSFGYMITTEATGSTSLATATLRLMSGSSYDSLSLPLAKGEWNHIAWTWNRNPYEQVVSGYVNQVLMGTSSGSVEFGDIYCPSADFIVGSGSMIVGGPGAFTPQTTLSGAIDELRVWSTVRTKDQRANFEKKNVFPPEDGSLLLKFSFNEPPGIASNMVIDSSDNSLHGKVSAAGMLLGVRNLVNSDPPMWFEKPMYCPVLFPDYSGLATLQTSLLTSAAEYDRINPNLITKLVPPHYLQEGQIADGLYTQQGAIVDPVQHYSDDPRSTTVGATQTLLVLLYTWAKFFDEMKLYLQAFSGMDNVSYENHDTVPDIFLQDMAARHGITLPPLFQESGIDQFINAENLDTTFGNSDLSLRDVQNQIWRRILINMQDFMKSKGTLHSVKSFIRSVGIDPDSNFRIREYGGPTRRTLEHTRDNKTEVSTMVDFSNGGFMSASLSDNIGLAKNEPGWPNFGNAGVFYTSASWTTENIVRFPTTMESGVSQSICRLSLNDSFPVEHMNLVAVKGGNTSLFVRNNSLLPMLNLSLSGVDLFDGGLWHVSCGRQRNDDPALEGHDLINPSSSYFLRVAKMVDGEIDMQNTMQVSAFYDDDGYMGANDSVRFCVGSSSFYMYSGVNEELLALSTTSSIAATNPTTRCTSFDGKAGHFRFWSKYLNEEEWYEHVRNYRSTGVVDPKTHFNFDTTATGSWERLRMDCSTDQEVIDTNGLGEITLTDFSQNNRVMTGSNFPTDTNVIVPQTFRFSYLSPKFDESASSDKVRIRGFLDYEMVEATPWAEQAPAYTIPRAEQPMDNERFSIDFSVTDALNQDIMTIFATLDEIDNAIGAPELLFADDYPDLEVLRKNYFNKLTGQMNIKGFFEFFQWFDTNIGTFVSQLLPRKTRFLGTNFLVEDHVLSRHKVKYHFEDMYLGTSNRVGLKDTILLQLITGNFKRY